MSLIYPHRVVYDKIQFSAFFLDVVILVTIVLNMNFFACAYRLIF